MQETPEQRLHTPLMLNSYEEYGCKINAITAEELFQKYERHGFLYPAKMQRLTPFMPLVRENWEKALRGGDLIHYVLTAELADGGWASVTSWRNTLHGWTTQHLVGQGPTASRAVMLAHCAHIGKDFSHQSWFQRTNRFAVKMFGSIAETLDSSIGWVGDYSYVALPLTECPASDSSVSVRQSNSRDCDSVRSLAVASRSTVFASSEELDGEDLHLEQVDDIYQKVGLRRYRRVLIAELKRLGQIAGCALAYRGPLGFNFSFLENRCDIILNTALTPIERKAVVASLLSTAAQHYEDFVPKHIPIVIDCRYANDILEFGGEHIRDYAQSVWLREGYTPWYGYVEGLYDRVIRAEKRRGLAKKDE